MVKINMYGPDGQIRESVDLAKQEPYNDPACQHLDIVEVEDDAIPDTVAKQCRSCGIGWLYRQNNQEK